MFGAPSDETLVKKALNGNADAWDKLIRRYEKRVYNFSLRMTGNREDAMDLMQNIFMAVYRGLANFRAESAFSSWLFSVASYRATDFYRRRRHSVDLDEEDAGVMDTGGASPFGEVWARQRHAGIMRAIGRLPEEQRMVLELKFFQDMTFEEISAQLGVSTNTLKSRLYGALRKIRQMEEVIHAV